MYSKNWYFINEIMINLFYWKMHAQSFLSSYSLPHRYYSVIVFITFKQKQTSLSLSSPYISKLQNSHTLYQTDTQEPLETTIKS